MEITVFYVHALRPVLVPGADRVGGGQVRAGRDVLHALEVRRLAADGSVRLSADEFATVVLVSLILLVCVSVEVHGADWIAVKNYFDDGYFWRTSEHTDRRRDSMRDLSRRMPRRGPQTDAAPGDVVRDSDGRDPVRADRAR